ncbi:hypothetical protein PHSY_004470 [Pseudozyma hubeiensis SY62]|uniref:Uncharacterized protein n=1 Tax=Pseudozyma hubeiensis (strain SY62) TaxID=1305764 RepID=R9P6B1_PSEHS|nr:hypothetical protein PHSY_004470 [Pseudozyma hubeiensis SY62]GAC96886.1 hypothetical protein PHSY_004470 [Pseudozyma hubeiensis SY62]
MTGIFAQQPLTHLRPASHQPSASTKVTNWGAPQFDMDPFHHPQPAQYAQQQHSSPLAGPSNLSAAAPAAATSSPSSSKGNYLPEQIFSSSPTERSLYPASTIAAVNATRARFFAQHSSSTTSRSRSRPTPTGSTTRSYKPQPFSTSSSSSSSYRKSFFERCQRAMDTSRSSARKQQIDGFRKGIHGGNRELFSDEMDQDDDDLSSPPPSSPPEEDEELTRRQVIAEYARLKRVYEAKGHAEIGWLDPDQLEWLEREMQGREEEEVVDPYWDATDDVLEELWRESMQSSQYAAEEQEDVGMPDEFDDEDEAFEEALAMLPV